MSGFLHFPSGFFHHFKCLTSWAPCLLTGWRPLLGLLGRLSRPPRPGLQTDTSGSRPVCLHAFVFSNLGSQPRFFAIRILYTKTCCAEVVLDIHARQQLQPKIWFVWSWSSMWLAVTALLCFALLESDLGLSFHA